MRAPSNSNPLWPHLRGCMRDSTCVDRFLPPSCELDIRERSEFPQYQTYQRYMRVVVLGVLRRTVFWA